MIPEAFKAIPIVAFLTLLSITASSCAGSASSTSDEDVGYISFSQSRALQGETVDDLENISLYGSLNGGTASVLKTWDNGDDIAGSTVEVTAGTWTLTIQAECNDAKEVYKASASTTIDAGETKSINMDMQWQGYKLSAAQSGWKVLANGYCMPASSTKTTSSAVDSIAVVSGGAFLCGIAYSNRFNTAQPYATDASVASSSWGASIPSGPTLQAIMGLPEADFNAINSALSAEDRGSILVNSYYWSTGMIDSSNRMVYKRDNSGNAVQAGVSVTSYSKGLYIKRY